MINHSTLCASGRSVMPSHADDVCCLCAVHVPWQSPPLPWGRNRHFGAAPLAVRGGTVARNFKGGGGYHYGFGGACFGMSLGRAALIASMPLCGLLLPQSHLLSRHGSAHKNCALLTTSPNCFSCQRSSHLARSRGAAVSHRDKRQQHIGLADCLLGLLLVRLLAPSDYAAVVCVRHV